MFFECQQNNVHFHGSAFEVMRYYFVSHDVVFPIVRGGITAAVKVADVCESARIAAWPLYNRI